MKEQLSIPIRKGDILAAAELAAKDERVLAEVYALLYDEDKRTSDNAAWVLMHLPPAKNKWLADKKEPMTDEALRTPSVTKRRLIMALLEKQEFTAEEIRTDFLDFCLARLVDPDEPYGIRALAAKLAYAQCRHFPELCGELRQTLELVSREPLKPGLRHIVKKLLKLLNDFK